MLPHMALLSSSFLCCAVVTQSSVERAVPAEIGCIWIIRMPNSLFKPDLLDLKMKQDAVNYFLKKKNVSKITQPHMATSREIVFNHII